MPSNLPPGVTEGMIPGNRPEDVETEYYITFAAWEIADMREFVNKQDAVPIEKKHELYPVIQNIMDQIDEQDEGD